MFYIKQSFGYADVITEIQEDNVFTKCAECGREFRVDLTKILTGDLSCEADVCQECCGTKSEGATCHEDHAQQRVIDSTAQEAAATTAPRLAPPNSRLIFVCSPYGGDIDLNTTNARRFCRFVYDQGRIPFAPHLLFPQFLREQEPSERNAGISMGVEILRHCDEVWAFGRRISPGMAYELTIAESRGKHIRHFDEACKEIEVQIYDKDC